MRLPRPHCLLWIIVLSATVEAPAAAQSTYTWSGTTANVWLSPGSWTGLPSTKFPGTTANGTGNNPLDEADFVATLPNSHAVGINMSSGAGGANQLLELGGISFQNGTNDLGIGNSSTTLSGTLLLNGASLPVPGIGYNNIIWRDVMLSP
jgi:hypothetical protein